VNVSYNIKLLSWFNFFSAFKIYSAFVVIYFTNITHSVALGISIISITQIADAVFEIPTGFMSDKIGRKQTLFLGALAKFFSLLCYAAGQSYLVFVLGSIFDGFALSLFSGNNEALLYDSVEQVGEKDRYHTYLGKIKSMAYPSLLIASLIGGVLATISLSLLFWLSIIPQIICLIIALLIVEPKTHVMKSEEDYHDFRSALKLLYKNPELRKLSIAEILTQGIEDVIFQMQILFYNLLWPIWAVGLTRSVMAIGKFTSLRFSGKLIDKFSATKILVFNTVATRVIHLFSILFPSLISPLAMSSTSFLWGPIEVSRNKLLQEQFTSKQRATMYSVLSLIGSAFAGILGITVGLITDKLGIIPTLLTLQLFFIPIIILYIQSHKAKRS
jgi:MFS family permease